MAGGNFGWWRQQQTAFFQVKTSNFPLRKFQVASHNTEEWGWELHQWSTRWTSHENLTHFIWHRVHGRNSELCLSFFGYSLYINLLSCASISAQTWIFHALQPANWKHRPVGTFGVLLLCKHIRRISASFTIPASLLYCPISQSGSNILCLI